MSWQARVVTGIARATLKRRSNPKTTVESVRARFERGVANVPKLSPGWRYDAVREGPLCGEWVRPASAMAMNEPMILYLHGGGYIFCSVATHRALAGALAVRSGIRALSLEYRLAPEAPFPAAVDDALAAYRALLDNGTPASGICLAGDSAGGGLALATALAVREQGLPPPAGLVLFSPLTDLAATGDSIRENSRSDALFFGENICDVARFYLPPDTPATHPLASPLYADLTGLPPMLIHASDSEVLRDDAVRLAERAQAAGVAVQFRLWHALPHVWQMTWRLIPEARESLDEAAAFLRQRVHVEATASRR